MDTDNALTFNGGIKKLPKKQNGDFNFGQKFQREQIKKTSPRNWDMSVLSVAIENCQTLTFRDQNQKETVRKLQDRRNHLCHKYPATYDSSSLDQLFSTLNNLFIDLLGPDGDSLCQELTRIKKMHIDVVTEEILERRDTKLDEAEQEEDVLLIHKELHDSILKSVEEIRENNESIIDHAAQITHLARDSTERCTGIQSALQSGATANITATVPVMVPQKTAQDIPPGYYRGKLNQYKTNKIAILHNPKFTKDDNGHFNCERTIEVVVKRKHSSDRPMSKKAEAEESAAKNAVLFIEKVLKLADSPSKS